MAQWRAEALLTAIAAGTPPDGGSNFDYPNLYARGAAINVQDMADTSEIVNRENILDWVYEYAFFGGEMIGVPGIESYVQYGLNYNSKAVEEAGLDPACSARDLERGAGLAQSVDHH